MATCIPWVDGLSTDPLPPPPSSGRGVTYQVYNTLKQRLFISKNIVFLEKEFLLREDSGSKGELGEVQSAQTDVDQLT